jgi:hypothetical protein
MDAQAGFSGTKVVWSCYGLCSGKMWLDVAAVALSLLLLLALARALRRATVSGGQGDPGRVVGFGGLGVVAALPFLGSAFNRLCMTSSMGVPLGCRTNVMAVVLAQGLALFAMGVWVASVGRDLRQTRGPAPLGPRRA